MLQYRYGIRVVDYLSMLEVLRWLEVTILTLYTVLFY